MPTPPPQNEVPLEERIAAWQAQGYVGARADPIPDDAYSVRGVGAGKPADYNAWRRYTAAERVALFGAEYAELANGWPAGPSWGRSARREEPQDERKPRIGLADTCGDQL